MKHFLFLAALCATVIFSNCKKDKDPDPVVKTPQELIIGNWKITSMLTDDEEIIEATVEYKTTGEITFANSGVANLAFTFTDLTVSPPDVATEPYALTYSWSGTNQLTITLDDGGDIYTVTGPATVTADKITFTATSGDTEDFIQSFKADKI